MNSDETLFHRISYRALGDLGATLPAALDRVEAHAEVDSSVWVGDREYKAEPSDRLVLRLDLHRHHHGDEFDACRAIGPSRVAFG